MKAHIEKTTDGKEVHFEIWGSFKEYGYAIHRFCTYCGSNKIERRKCWPECKCLECGLVFHDSSTEQTHDDFMEHQNNDRG